MGKCEVIFERALKSIPYVDLGLDRAWREHDIDHELTTQGMKRFSADWDQLLAR